MIINCAQCGKEKNIRRERLKPKNYCSKTCSGKSRQTKILLNCKVCGTVMLKHPFHIKRHGTSLFCSRKCQTDFQVGPNSPKYVHIDKPCKICGEQIPHDIAVKQGTTCCSKECRTIALSGTNHYLWRGGVSFFPYPKQFTKQLKEKIKDRDGHQCQGCGADSKEAILAVHHIDSDKNNCSEENLITTCQKCNNSAKRMRDYWINFYTYNLCKRGLGNYEWRVQKSQRFQ